MSQKKKILRILEEHGLVTTKMVTENGLSRRILSQLEDQKLISRIERGIYAMNSECVDRYFLLQYRFPQGVFSHETALHLLDHLDQEPQQLHMTFPVGFNSLRAKNAEIQPIISKDVTVGIRPVSRSGGTTIHVYEIERTLLDLLKPKYTADKEQFFAALKHYLCSDQKDIPKLLNYARLFNLESKIQPYLEVLL
ncbi:type IV toxin-antitoxin system AbiEi family antitoxin domain-containing protein [Enterococcus sp. AZ072]|uniref:type IV toxin-antitoxin system AbiEi family antitoxin domain-containing protein n=1 Tax=unclassified Enterococcus TaxID=2608891 RepID=UPI003D2D69E3